MAHTEHDPARRAVDGPGAAGGRRDLRIVKDLNDKEKVSFLLAEQNTNIALKYAHYGYIWRAAGGDGRRGEGPGRDEDVKEFYSASRARGARASATPSSIVGASAGWPETPDSVAAIPPGSRRPPMSAAMKSIPGSGLARAADRRLHPQRETTPLADEADGDRSVTKKARRRRRAGAEAARGDGGAAKQ